MSKIKKEFENIDTGLKSVEQIRKQVSTIKNPVTVEEVKSALEDVDAYTLNKPTTRNFPRRHVNVRGIDDQFQADLVDMQRYMGENDKYKYILTVIDVFSKYAWAVPLTSKMGKAVATALEKIFSERKPRKLQTDDGKEFFNTDVRKILAKHDIKLFSTNSEYKAAIVERFNRTLREKIAKYNDTAHHFRYLDILPKLVDNYNNTFHTSIQMSPEEVNEKNEGLIFHNMYDNALKYITQTPPKIKFQAGDFVRISKANHIFRKGTEGNWTIEVFEIDSVEPTEPITYKIKDLMGEEVDGGFYEKELQKVKKPQTFAIEKIIKRRTKNGVKEAYVKYLGYPDKFNEWNPENNFKKT